MLNPFQWLLNGLQDSQTPVVSAWLFDLGLLLALFLLGLLLAVKTFRFTES